MNKSGYGSEREVFIQGLVRARKAQKFILPKNLIIEQHEFTSMQEQVLSLARSSKLNVAEPVFKKHISSPEHSHLYTFRALRIRDAAYETLFESITKLACQICYTPISLISFIDTEAPLVKIDSPTNGTVGKYALFSSNIMSDTTHSTHYPDDISRFADNPIVVGKEDFLFYASVPISFPLGEKIGEICVIDRKENYLTEPQKLCLEGLADVISKAITTRNMSVANL